MLAGLSGPHQKHFVRMEQKLGVRVAMRGNIVSIEGPPRERAAGVLRALYARLEAGEAVGAAELDSEIRFAGETPGRRRRRRRSARRRSRPGRGTPRAPARRRRRLISI